MEWARSESMRKISASLAHVFAFALFLIAGPGIAHAQTTKTGTSKAEGSQEALSCTRDTQCPSGQRCGFTSARKSGGKCVLPNHDAHCFNPGGRCGCDGRPVDIFCAAGSRTEYTSAPACFVGPCPRTCTEESDCGKTGLVCQKGVCVKP
jgi:hypothetical protein